MALKVKGIVDGGMHAEKTLGRARRLEALHFVLSSSHRLMRIFGSVVLPEPLYIRDRLQENYSGSILTINSPHTEEVAVSQRNKLSFSA